MTKDEHIFILKEACQNARRFGAMDAATKAAFMALSKAERQAMMWVGFHMEGRA